MTGWSTAGAGLTVIAKVVTPPEQPFTVAETLIVVVKGVKPAFVEVNAGIIPVPEIPNPTSLLLVQLNVGLPPVAEVENKKPAWLAPEQSV